jgi:membrane protease YdiL (CAAX protease family)
MAASVLAHALVPPERPPKGGVVVGVGTLVSIIALESVQAGLVLAFAFRWRAFAALRLRGPWLRGIVIGIPIGFAFQLGSLFFLAVLQKLVPGFDPADAAGPIERSFGELGVILRIAFVVAGGVMAPIAEELLFRGLLLYGLRSPDWRRGSLFAICTSSILFAAVHLNFWGFAVFAALGALLAWVTLKKGSVAYAIGVHLGFNLTAFMGLMLRFAN